MTPIDPRIHPELVPEGSRPVVIGHAQEAYLDLPSIVTPHRLVITRWEPTDAERLGACFAGPDSPLPL